MNKKFDLDYLAELMRLHIRADERDAIEQKLTAVIDMIERVSEQPTENVEPLSHPLDILQPLRDDTSNSELNLSEWMRDAPQTEDGFYTVPKVIS